MLRVSHNLLSLVTLDPHNKPQPLNLNYFTEMCSGSEAGSYLRLIHFVYHSTLGVRVIKKKKKRGAPLGPPPPHPRRRGDNLNGFKDFRAANGSSQGQNLSLTGLFVPSSLGSTSQNVQRFRGGLVFKTHRLLYHSTLGLRVIKKKKRGVPLDPSYPPRGRGDLGCRV